MEQQNQEYCKYILFHNSDSPNMNIPFEDVSLNIKEKFLIFHKDVIATIKQEFRIKEEKYRSDKLLLDVISSFMHSRILFFGYKRDDNMDKLYKHLKALLETEKSKFKKNEPVSLDIIFDILYNMSLILMNSMISVNEGEKVVTYHTTNIEISKILTMMDSLEKISENVDKHQKAIDKYEEFNKKIPTLAQVALGFVPVVQLIFTVPSTKCNIDSMNLKKAERKRLKFTYFKNLLLCTQVHANEISERYGNYGW